MPDNVDAELQGIQSINSRLISTVILDLDGTLIDTESLVEHVLKDFLAKYEKQWDGRGEEKRLGKRPLEAAECIIEDYQLPCTAEEFLAEISPWFEGRQGCWRESFSFIIGGDEVTKGKPSPEIFLEAAKKLQVKPECCLVIEDSLPGVAAGKAAGMEVIAVPSIQSQISLYSAADHVLSSLLDLRPELWGLPPFEDWIANVLPVEPWYIGGPVIKGFGCGSKILGIPTANLSVDDFSTILTGQVSGVYLGWADRCLIL